MRAVVQRVRSASVTVVPPQGEPYVSGEIGCGILLLVCFVDDDAEEDLQWIAKKVSCLRIFDDGAGVMNRPVTEVSGEVLAVSQFTLMASAAKGNRPSYIRAARPEISSPLFDRFVDILSGCLGKPVPTGVFGADMKVSLVNDGPVTIIMDSKDRNI